MNHPQYSSSLADDSLALIGRVIAAVMDTAQEHVRATKQARSSMGLVMALQVALSAIAFIIEGPDSSLGSASLGFCVAAFIARRELTSMLRRWEARLKSLDLEMEAFIVKEKING